jgi:alkylation response protein AidB-like acyl-CoA dehydrogenase
MDFTLTPEQEKLRDRVRAWAEAELAPTVKDRDERQVCERAVWDAAARAGLAGLAVPPAYGGEGRSFFDYILALEAVGQVESAQVLILASHAAMITCVQQQGTDEQKARWLPPLARGDLFACFSLTEPGAGSDPASMKTVAVRDGDSYVLNGKKTFATNSGVADVYVLFALTDPEAGGRGVSAFLLDRETPGLQFGPPISKLGMRTSVQREVTLTDVRVPADRLLGREGSGLRTALAALDLGRVAIAIQGVALAQAAYEAALRYAKERAQFGKPIAQNQGVSFPLADMAMQIEAARLLTYKAAALVDAGQPFGLAAAMAKCFATDVAMHATTDAVQIFGGLGVTTFAAVERFFRDAKVAQIYEGTNQVQRVVISTHILR